MGRVCIYSFPLQLSKESEFSFAISSAELRLTQLRVLRTDHDDEFTSVEFAAYYADQGVVRHHTAERSLCGFGN